MIRVLIAGIGGASLGTEVHKALLLTGEYEVFGCDISQTAYGHYEQGFVRTYLVRRETYLQDVLQICSDNGVQAVIPGGEEPLALLRAAIDDLERHGVRLAANAASVVDIFSDKLRTFRVLEQRGFRVPWTRNVTEPAHLRDVELPCVIKPATGSGGSSFVFLAATLHDAELYLSYLIRQGKGAVLQEYLPLDDGEFTIGVLSLPDGSLVGSVALKRALDSKLSVLFKGKAGTISSGYSQGLIDDFSSHRKVAEAIAEAFGSAGPLNVQGRVKEGVFMPFEINPRFSASTYLRALAGFNEVHIYLQALVAQRAITPEPLRPGYYLRSLSEVYVRRDAIKR